MQKAETRSNILSGLNTLPDYIREAMVLRHVKDMPYEEIAGILNCPVGTVKSRIARGRELLRGYLMKMDGESVPPDTLNDMQKPKHRELAQ